MILMTYPILFSIALYTLLLYWNLDKRGKTLILHKKTMHNFSTVNHKETRNGSHPDNLSAITIADFRFDVIGRKVAIHSVTESDANEIFMLGS